MRLSDGAWYLSDVPGIQPEKFPSISPRKRKPAERLDIVLHLTNACNLACKYCYARDAGAELRDIRPSIIKDLIQAAGNSSFTHLNIIFHGGEPLARWPLIENIVETARNSSSKRFSFALQTNGVGLNSNQASFIKKHAIHLSISLDGSRDTHDKYRFHNDGAGSYDKVIQSVRLLNQEGIPFGINTVLHADSDPDSYLKTLTQHSIRNINLTPIGYPAEASLPKAANPVKKTLANYTAIISKIVDFNQSNTARIIEMGALSKIAAISGKGGFSKCDNFPCHKNGNLLMIDQDGNLFPCEEWYGQPKAAIGNISAQGSLDPGTDTAAFHDSLSRKVSDFCSRCIWTNFCGRICPKYFAVGDHSLCEFNYGVFDFLFSLAAQGRIHLLTHKRRQ